MRYLKIIGLIIFIYIIFNLNFQLVWNTLESIHYKSLFIYICTFYIFFILKVYRWHTIQNFFSKELTFKENYLVWMETIYLSFVTPAKIGDIARVWVLNKWFGIEKKESFYAYFFDRFQDILFLVIGALIGLYYIDIIVIRDTAYYIFFVFIFIGYIAKDFFISKMQTKFTFLYHKPSNLKFELKVFLINLITYIFYFLQFYFLAQALNIDLNYGFVIGLISLSTLATIVPISIAGLGVREGVFIVLLGTVGIQQESAVILSLLGSVFFVAVFIVILHLITKLFVHKEINV